MDSWDFQGGYVCQHILQNGIVRAVKSNRIGTMPWMSVGSRIAQVGGGSPQNIVEGFCQLPEQFSGLPSLRLGCGPAPKTTNHTAFANVRKIAPAKHANKESSHLTERFDRHQEYLRAQLLGYVPSHA